MKGEFHLFIKFRDSGRWYLGRYGTLSGAEDAIKSCRQIKGGPVVENYIVESLLGGVSYYEGEANECNHCHRYQ